MTKNAAWRTGCDAFSPAKLMSPNTVYAASMANIAGFAPVPSLFEIPMGDIVKWYGTCSDIHDSKLLEQSIRDNAIELERMVDLPDR